jgi:hypothetical protein
MNIETTPNGTSFAGRFAKFDPATVFESAGRCGMIDPSIRPVPRQNSIGLYFHSFPTSTSRAIQVALNR